MLGSFPLVFISVRAFLRAVDLGKMWCCKGLEEGVNHMPKKEILDKLSIYIPQSKMKEKPVERLMKLADKRDRSINYLVVDAILEYLKREEKKEGIAIPTESWLPCPAYLLARWEVGVLLGDEFQVFG